jgi:putative ABC transport system substrate-binding protein
MAQDDDPVGSGFASSLARPGGNITGSSTLSPEISGKRLELFKEIVPKLSRVAVIGEDVTRPGVPQALREINLAADAFRVQVQYLEYEVPRISKLHSEPQARSVLRQPSPCGAPC